MSLTLALWATLAGADPEPLDRARQLYAEGRLQEALAAYQRVATDPAAPPEVAAIARNNACAILNTLADYPAAFEECQQALRLRRGLDDPRRLARTLNNLAISLQYQGRFDEAILTYREALDINRRRGDLEAQCINLQNLGLVVQATGRYREALELLAEAESLTAEHAGEPWARRQNQLVRFNRGVVLEKLGAYRQALEIYQQLAAEKTTLEPGHWASLQVNLGVMYRNLGDPVKAVRSFEQAAATYEQLGDSAALSNTLLNMALAWHRNLGREQDAEAAYRRALELARASGDRSEEVQDLFYLGGLLLETGRLDEAELAFESCLEVAEASGSAEGRWSALAGLGRTAAARVRPHRALQRFDQAITEIERVRANLSGGRLRSGYFGDKRPVYEDAVELLAELARLEPDAAHPAAALELVQRTKSRELLESLGSERTAEPLTTDELVALARDRVVLEYFFTDDRLFQWIVRRDGARMVDLGPAEPVLQGVLEAHRLLAAGREPPVELLESLSQALLGDVAADLETTRRLHVAPDRRLHYLPFEILPLPGSDAVLVERLEITYLPSASALAWLGRQPRPTGLVVAGFGAPDLAPAGIRGALADQLTSRFDLGPLPGAERELGRITDLMPGEHEIRVGGEATEPAFKLAASRGARVLHLATHTVVDERPGHNAAVLLSPAGDDDGLLQPSEIAGLHLRAELTVLAACRSALAGDEDGRTFTSLTGSFLAAGSSAVVASLWDVGDEASVVFMEQLYYQLGRGLSPARALRRAKLRLRSDPEWGRTDLWAGFILLGDAAPVVAPSRWPLWSGLAIALVLMAAAARRRRARSVDVAPQP